MGALIHTEKKDGLSHQIVTAHPFLEPHQSDRMTDSVFCGSDEQQPLCREVRDENKIVTIWDRFYEFVPCEDEIGEYEENSSESEDAAALEHRSHKHAADKYRIDAHSYLYHALRDLRYDSYEHDSQKCDCTERYHGKVSFCLASEFTVLLHFLEISADEIRHEPYVS